MPVFNRSSFTFGILPLLSACIIRPLHRRAFVVASNAVTHGRSTSRCEMDTMLKCFRRVCHDEAFRSTGSLRLAPPLKVVDDRGSATPCNDPPHILVAVVDFLMLGICWNEGKVAWRKLLSLRPVRPAHDGTVAACCVYDCV
jgi:hypothetical protein